ncbi:hypothetical protein AAKU52_001947 [Pedobacter sp. CG_S7]|uniref:ice-binding family protein n=1 Tax=Pedobacter sp. CG_S7 TaxID=3143930 RepID=UPI00339AFCFC
MNKKPTLKYNSPSCSRTSFSRIKTTLYATVVLFAVIMTGCRKDDFEGEISGDCPVVVTTDPKDKAVDVPLNKVISITFNTDMDATTINNSTFIVKQGTKTISGKIAPTAVAKTFTFTPDAPLSPFTTYTGVVTTGAKDNLKTAMVSDYTWTFITIPQVVLSFTPALSGTVSGGGEFAQGSVNTITAVPNTGFTFTNWTDNGTVVSTSSNYSLTMAGNKALVAHFTAIPFGSVALNLTSSPAAGGTTLGSGSYQPGTPVTISATANSGYSFVNWTENGNIISTNTSFQFTILASRNLVANFKGAEIGLGPIAINLGSAADFVTLTKSGISTTGTTLITGNIGVSPAAATAITGFGLIMDTNGQSSHTPIVIGKVYAANYAAPTPAKMTTAVSDMETAFTTANGLTTPAPIVGLYSGDISGRTLTAGLYKWSTGVLITNAGVTLTGGPNDVWVFQISQNLTVNNSAKITLLGGAQAKNIFWVVSGQATLGSDTDFSGIILSKTLISLNTGAKVTGRLLAQTAVTLNASTVTQPQ